MLSVHQTRKDARPVAATCVRSWTVFLARGRQRESTRCERPCRLQDAPGLGRVRMLLAAALLVGGLVPDAVRADEQEEPASAVTPENPKAAQEARRLYHVGVKAFEARNYREAVRAFHLAGQSVPSADLSYNIARAHEELREYEAAIDAYQAYLRDRVDPPDEDVVKERIAALKEAMAAEQARAKNAPTDGLVRVEAKPDPVDKVTIGGSELPDLGLKPLRLKPGLHDLRVDKEGYIPGVSRLKVEGGDDFTAFADLQPKTHYEASRGKPRWFWVLAGLGVGTLGATIGAGIRSHQLDRQDDEAGSRRWSRVSDGMLGATLALGIGAFVTYFVERRSTSSTVKRPAPDTEAAVSRSAP